MSFFVPTQQVQMEDAVTYDSRLAQVFGQGQLHQYKANDGQLIARAYSCASGDFCLSLNRGDEKLQMINGTASAAVIVPN